ncbi:MAG TPA: hypothetical protein PK681_10155 [Steroidobacteraceae bacterium]|nr:hypothetical protein [Steroidobacteraceae bacterium]HQX77088.1 hypothetical protein [Steroidobacteraceae bacterium]HQZ80968.1 hypothetical protein [Steroidobacteraceae bacterium]
MSPTYGWGQADMTRYATLIVVAILSDFLAACSAPEQSDERVQLPFSNIEGDFDITLPPGTVGRGNRDGAIVGDPLAVRFESPVHPLGHVKSLMIEGYDVALEATELNDGMLSTQRFGDLEFLLVGPAVFELRATKSQVSQIQLWLTETGASSATSAGGPLQGESPGDPVEFATAALRSAGHDCAKVVSAKRVNGGSIMATCSDGEDYRITSHGDYGTLALKCSVLRRVSPETLVDGC